MTPRPVGRRSGPDGVEYLEVCLDGSCSHHHGRDARPDADERENDPNPISARERQVALYASGLPLRPQMRRKRAALDAAVRAGMAVLGSDRMIELAAMADLLTEHSAHWHGAREDVHELWPDRTRFKLAGQLAESPIWDGP